MGAVRCGQRLVALLIVLTAACGASETVSPEVSPGPQPELSGEPATFVSGAAGPADSRSEAMPFATTVPTSVASAIPEVVEIPVALAESAPGAADIPDAAPAVVSDAENAAAVTATLPDPDSLLKAAQNSTFHQFGDDVYTWSSDRRVVILKMPVGHPALDEVRDLRGHRDGIIEDTPESRSWVQRCARRQAEPALSTYDAVYGAVSAQSVYSCLGGFAHLVELFARYWWTDSGVACVADAVTAHSFRGDAHPRPLSICPSAGYDPAAPQQPGWLGKRCADIVAANPNSKFPTDPAVSREPLPSCWAPIVEIVEDQASENVEFGLTDSPHDCYHAFLGYVWARQTGRDNRPPNDLAIGCHYRAFEAIA